MKKIFNFNAGPATLPEEVLKTVKKELYNWNGLGISILEANHRSKEFMNLAKDVEINFRNILDIPENYVVLFCHGGARAQFSAVPMNLLTTPSDNVDYINTGYWSHNAAMEAQKYCNPNIINVSHKINNSYSIIPMCQWELSDNSVYMHYCPNETIHGISIDDDLTECSKIIVADFSSALLSRPLKISSFGIIYAAAQKNIGISGLTIVIVREDILQKSHYNNIPSILDYQILSNHHPMFNTPTTISWYVAYLVCKWLKKQGGLDVIYKRNQEKANLLYKTIDTSDFYYNNVNKCNRSYMNVPFFLKNKKLNDLFLKESLSFGLCGLQGHRVIGGMRASLYNAMSLEGVHKLVQFMQIFSKKYG